MSPILQVLLALDTSRFAAGAEQARSAVNQLAAGIGSRLGGVLSVDFLAREALKIVKFADDVGDMAAKLGVSTDQIQEFQYAARKTGASVESFTTAIRTLIAAQQDALNKGVGSEAFKPFAALGVSFEEMKRLAPDRLLYRVGDAFKASAQEGADLNAVISLMGRGAMDLMGALKEGLREIAVEAHSTGQVISEEVVGTLGAANDAAVLAKQKTTVVAATTLGVIYSAAAMLVAIGAGAAIAAAGLFSKRSVQLGQIAALGSFRSFMGLPFLPPGTDAPKPAPSMWDRIGDPGAATNWRSVTIGAEAERSARLLMDSADALARIGLFRGGYDPGERTRLQQLAELRNINRQVADTNRLLRADPI